MSEAERMQVVANEEKQIALNHRNAEMASKKGLAQEIKDLTPPLLVGHGQKIGKLKKGANAFYSHVNFGFDWLRRFDISDVPPLVVAVLRKLGSESKTDLCWQTLMADGMTSERRALLTDHKKEIGEHLRTNVYTADHCSLLRPVGGMSKRLCGLIEQSVKYMHNPRSICNTIRICNTITLEVYAQ